ncbi:MAG: SDR family NAD(P)-dependent oxidoreductase [Phycisphaerae bacterium]|nr:SDR family NAD(P)-dependent oxidoreductase [Phycisphaerae bacterium]
MGYDLRNRVVLVTGASSGIGEAAARAFHGAGARVVAAARSLEKLKALAQSLGGDRVLPVSMDVTDASDRGRGLAQIRERWGGVDVLVNNAGWGSFASVLRMPEEHLDRMLALNFAAPIALIQAVLPEMIDRGSGQIINISSVVGHQPMPRMASYSATKAALNALSTALRLELRGTGVDVLLVAPGSTNTPFFEVAGSVDVRAVRLGQAQYSPERVARAIVTSSRRRRREVTLTPAGKLIVFIRRFSHRFADSLIYQTAKHAMPEMKSSQGSSREGAEPTPS